jgi:hypothetical protein
MTFIYFLVNIHISNQFILYKVNGIVNCEGKKMHGEIIIIK